MYQTVSVEENGSLSPQSVQRVLLNVLIVTDHLYYSQPPVQIFSGMFQGTANFNQDLSNWNVGSGTAFDRMFQGAISFASDISGWDLTNAGTTASMFEEALAFNVDLSNWSIGNVLDFSRMFRGAVTYDQGKKEMNTEKDTVSTNWNSL